MVQFIQDPNIVTDRVSATTVDLRCPRCQGQYLHQQIVTVFDRGEDAQKVTMTRVAEHVSVALVDNNTSGNPSSRRHGMSIGFMCETCSVNDPDDIIELILAQHKGVTEMGWRYTPRRPQPQD